MVGIMIRGIKNIIINRCAEMAPQTGLSNYTIVVTAALLLVAVIGTISYGEQQPLDDRLSISVSILPQADFAAAVTGEHAIITVMIPPGGEPHTYEPTSAQMRHLESADIYFKVGSGIDFELAWMDKFIEINPTMVVVDGSEGARLISSEIEHDGCIDPHIWLCPPNAKVMVENLFNTLVLIDPDNASDYRNNSEEFLEALDRIDAEISAELELLENRGFISYHSSWQYFAMRYGLEQLSVEQDGKEPTSSDLAELIDTARENDIDIVLVSPEFSSRAAQQIAREIGGAVIHADPLSGDYIETLRNLAFDISNEGK